MADSTPNDTFATIIAFLTVDVRRRLADALAAQPGLAPAETTVFIDSADRALLDNAARKLNRVLLLELHAAKLSGELTASDEPAKFAQFVAKATRPDFVLALRQRYPALAPRLERALAQQGQGIVTLASRLVADRDRLATFMGQSLGELRALDMGQGDVHDGGQTVARVTFAHGIVMYKPRSLRVDAALDTFLDGLLGDVSPRIRVPAVLDRGDYGWTRYVEHIFCADDTELVAFYRNIGHWLAVMRLLGGTDIHHENLIACGPVPYIVDVESLFVTEAPMAPTGKGDAVDLAQALIRSSVLRTGLVPFRAPVLGLDGVDISAIGALQGEQPTIRGPEIVNAGTSEARVGLVDVEVGEAKNHPCRQPDISRFWEDIIAGFQSLNARLDALHRDGTLAGRVAAFQGSRIRRIRRPTQSYVEVMRMLWHPASLHDEPAAIARATDLLKRNAAVSPVAPADAASIAGEIEDMRHGDIPVFANVLEPPQIDEVFQAWLDMRPEMEELTIRGALVTAHLNVRLNDDKRSPYDLTAHHPHADDLDRRRRAMAKATVEQLLRLSVRGRDGTMTWISPILGRGGWTMRTLQPNLYVGLSGIALALAGYAREMTLGRVDEVDGVSEALDGVLRVLRKAEDTDGAEAIGGFIGLGSQVLTWLTLDGLCPDAGMLAHAITQGARMERWDIENERMFDMLEGVSGAIVPLLHLADATGDDRWLAVAARAGRRLEATAILDARGARWPASIFSEPIGGFAHGATGTGWALARLGLSKAGTAADRQRWLALAERAFDFEESLYDDEGRNWIDVRKPDSRDFANTWCHGSVGIGLAACDLYARTGQARHLSVLQRAVSAAVKGGWGYSHTLCHGDLSTWELLMRARRIDPALVPSEDMPGIAIILSSIEEHGIVGGLARDAFTPGLMSGISGSIHQLNRMHPESDMASPLLMECGVGEGVGFGFVGSGLVACLQQASGEGVRSDSSVTSLG
ncbi:type 2 lanthipeptide synthetase LanM family protein [Luteibacter sahnii]|uniref:type 2 lanthipeptide synthetase LanM family protein n=1 Tax=Luteibacter sahnii TaxID=3021977 RepID=UPI002A6A3122|nr:type 2 lanthipeptide synthetase LanM family protein [Luteibacter sp. PPL193]MDY1549854.1 type 2 lanthipeptide synthetase LanM family protein [Luteibacter sp. PPL193]